MTRCHPRDSRIDTQSAKAKVPSTLDAPLKVPRKQFITVQPETCGVIVPEQPHNDVRAEVEGDRPAVIGVCAEHNGVSNSGVMDTLDPIRDGYEIFWFRDRRRGEGGVLRSRSLCLCPQRGDQLVELCVGVSVKALAQSTELQERRPILVAVVHRGIDQALNEIVKLNGVPVDVVGASADAAACWVAIKGSGEHLLCQWHGGWS